MVTPRTASTSLVAPSSIFWKYFDSHNQPASYVQSSLNPEPLFWRGLDGCPADGHIPRHTFGTRGFPLCPLSSGAASNLTLKSSSLQQRSLFDLSWRASVDNSFSLCLVPPSGTPWGARSALSIKHVITGFLLIASGPRKSGPLGLSRSVNKLSRCVMHNVCVRQRPRKGSTD